MKKKIFVIIVIFMVSALMVSCNSCMRSSAEPSSQGQYHHLDSTLKANKDSLNMEISEVATSDTPKDINKQPKTTPAQRDSLYLSLEKTQNIILQQQKTIDSLMMYRKKIK